MVVAVVDVLGAAADAPGAGLKGLVQVVADVGCVLDTDGQTDKTFTDAEALALFGREIAVGTHGGV